MKYVFLVYWMLITIYNIKFQSTTAKFNYVVNQFSLEQSSKIHLSNFLDVFHHDSFRIRNEISFSRILRTNYTILSRVIMSLRVSSRIINPSRCLSNINIKTWYTLCKEKHVEIDAANWTNNRRWAGKGSKN